MNKWAMMYGNSDRYNEMNGGMDARRNRGGDGRYNEMEDRRNEMYGGYDRSNRYDRYDRYDRSSEMRGDLIGFERKKEEGLIGPDNRYNEIRNGKVIPMQREEKRGKEEEKQLSMKEARKWVEEMKGAPFSEEDAWRYAQEMGLDDEEIFPSFFAAMNAVYTDYEKVAKEFHVHKPEFYAKMAKAWICDEDAVENKAAMYYKNVVERE